MFWTKADLDLVSIEVSKIFGPQGRYSTVDQYFNIKIKSKIYGDLWYGDMDSLQDIEAKCIALKKALSTDKVEDTIIATVYTKDDRVVVTV